VGVASEQSQIDGGQSGARYRELWVAISGDVSVSHDDLPREHVDQAGDIGAMTDYREPFRLARTDIVTSTHGSADTN
jgi:hypothetical protein